MEDNRKELIIDENSDQVNNKHDKTFKSFLQNRDDFYDMLQSFVKADWVDDIDKESLQLQNSSFIRKDYKEKESDIIYCGKIRETDIYFYVLLELQSTVDYRMPLRLLQYMTELWNDIVEKKEDAKKVKRIDYKIPAIIPIVLYNGQDNWTAETSFGKYQSGYEYFKNYIVDFTYVLMDINRYGDEELDQIANLMATVFALDQGNRVSPEELLRKLRRRVDKIATFTPEQWQRFMNWIKVLLLPKLSDKHRKEFEELIENINANEVDRMVMNIERNIDRWFDEAHNKGLVEGIEKGIDKGRIVALGQLFASLIKKGKTIEEVSELLELSNDLKEEFVKKYMVQ